MLGTVNGRAPQAVALSKEAFEPMLSPQISIYKAQNPGETTMSYGFGFFIDDPDVGGRVLHHAGAYSWGTGTNVSLLPSADIGIVVLTNAWPTGVSEALSAQFLDLVQFGESRKDWYAHYSEGLATAFDPQGELVGQEKPEPASPAKELHEYAGTYHSPYYDQAQVVVSEEGLELHLGPKGEVKFSLQHWDGDHFTFAPFNDSAGPGSISQADFSDGRLVLEHYNSPHSSTVGLGVFTR